MIVKSQTTNHGSPIPTVFVEIGYRILKSHMEGDIEVIDYFRLTHSSIRLNGTFTLYGRE